MKTKVEHRFVMLDANDEPQEIVAKLNRLGEKGWSYAFKHGLVLYLHRLVEAEEEEVRIESGMVDERGHMYCAACDLFVPGMEPKKIGNAVGGVCSLFGFTTNSVSLCIKSKEEIMRNVEPE